MRHPGGLGMNSTVMIQSQGRQPFVVSFSTSNLQWLDEMRMSEERTFSIGIEGGL